jgi:CspA family cold shock protein
VRANALSRILETINGNWNSEVVQRDKGLRLYSAPDGGRQDIFVHISAVERAGLSSLNDGQKVSFEAKTDSMRGKTSAENFRVD